MNEAAKGIKPKPLEPCHLLKYTVTNSSAEGTVHPATMEHAD